MIILICTYIEVLEALSTPSSIPVTTPTFETGTFSTASTTATTVSAPVSQQLTTSITILHTSSVSVTSTTSSVNNVAQPPKGKLIYKN